MEIRDQWIALQTILFKEIRRITRIWIQTVIPPAITTSLYFLIFGNLIGPRIGEMSGHRYMDFIVPGLIMMAVISNSYANVVSSFFGAKFQRHVEEMLVSPMPNYIILLGYIGGGVARGLMVGVVVTMIALFFSELHVHSVPVLISVVFLTSVLFSLGGFINAVYARSFDDISIIPTFILTPLTYLGGVFYSIQLLPDIWQMVSLVNPILYMVNTFRFGFLGVTDIPVLPAYGIILVFVAGLYLFALGLLNRGVGIRD